MLGIAAAAIPMTQAFGAIGGGSPTTAPTAPEQVISRAEQRVHDLAGGQTGSFNVGVGGKNNPLLFYALCIAGIWYIIRGKLK